MAGKGSRATLVIAVGIVAALVGVAVWYGLGRNQGRLSPEEALQLIHAKNVALGQLENQENDKAVSSFQPLLKRVPTDPLPARNLAAARAVALGEDDPKYPIAPEAVAAAKGALQEVKRREGESIAYHWLALHVARMESDRAEADSQIEVILKKTPEDATAWFARYQVYQMEGPTPLHPKSLAAIESACRLNPENTWYRLEWLRAMSELFREKPAPQIDRQHLHEQLAATSKAVQPFAYLIHILDPKYDVPTLIAAVQAAVDAADWGTADLNISLLGNVVLPHASPDRVQARRHPLEFVLEEFQPVFYQSMRIQHHQEDATINVAFSKSPWKQDESLGDQLTGALDFQIVDFNLDGGLDLVVLTAKAVVVLTRKSPTDDWGVLVSLPAEGFTQVLAHDFDADFDEVRLALRDPKKPNESPAELAKRNICPTADVDLILTGPAGVLVVENHFDKKTLLRSLVPIVADDLTAKLVDVTAAAAVDLEADGDLDVAFAAADGIHLWSHLSGLRFLDISARSVLPEAAHKVTQLLPVDWDRDVDVDILVASPQGSGYLENLRHGQFRWRPFDGEFSPLAAAHFLEVLESDGNASWDALAAVDSGIVLGTTTTPESGVIRYTGTKQITQTPASGLIVWDYDNDSHGDVFSWSNKGAELLRGGAEFSRADLLSALASPLTKALAGDFDNDGDLDLVVLTGNELSQWENAGGNENHWINIALAAQQNQNKSISPSGRVSPYGNSSLLELKSGRRYQAQVVRGQVTHFGLGKARLADVIRLLWVNGVPQNIVQPEIDTFICEQQQQHGSCPYLYAWDGEKFVFCTDLLWNAPLGLQYAENVIAQPREWEYLKISGEQLAAKDGHYQLQLTEELWEAAYFDQVRLIAVDHPAEVEVYSNEKVGPAEIAEHKIHTVRKSRPLRSAKNHHGRDLLGDIESADGMYAAVHDKKLRQGVVEDGYMELDLGNLQDAKQVTLFLTGWIYPSGTSINVALSQGGPLPPGKPPAVWTPDGQGGWKETIPFMGFPGGKTKTIAVDLSGKLTPGDGRIRIATSMEFYWDHIFFTADESPAEVRTEDLKLVAADLHYRGFSRIEHDRHNGPEHFIYDDISQSPKWPPMAGSFTRYGDVLPLLRERDDRLVVMGAGDEATLRFAVPKDAPPPGWKRDFLIFNVGWDKDCNLLTVLGETSEPSPFAAMSGYPWKAEEAPPKTSGAREGTQGRTQAPTFWRSVLRFGVGTGN